MTGPLGRRRRWRSVVAAGCAAVLIVGGCENTVTTFVEDEMARPFFVYGYLDSGADTQFVRVAPIAPTLEASTTEQLDAQVRTTSLTSGDVVAWTDSLVILDDGSAGHLFYGLFRPEPGASYRLEVARSDGASTTATTRVPAHPEVRVDPVRTSGTVLIQDVTWDGISAPPFEALVRYHVSRYDETMPTLIRRSYLNSGHQERSSWTTSIQLSRDRDLVAQALGTAASDPPPALYRIEMLVSFGDDAWYRPDAVQVVNGTGFFGSVGRFSVAWALPDEVVSALELTNRQPQ